MPALAVSKPLQYRLLPSYTIRRFLRPKVRITGGKRTMFPHPVRVLRQERYKPLPEGMVWPPVPDIPDHPRARPKKKKRKPIPPEILAEWARARRVAREGALNPPMLHSSLDQVEECSYPDDLDYDMEAAAPASSHGDSAVGEIPEDVAMEDWGLGLDDPI